MTIRTKINELNQSKLPIVPIDKRLEKYKGKVLFPEKLELANKILKKAKLPSLQEKSNLNAHPS